MIEFDIREGIAGIDIKAPPPIVFSQDSAAVCVASINRSQPDTVRS